MSYNVFSGTSTSQWRYLLTTHRMTPRLQTPTTSQACTLAGTALWRLKQLSSPTLRGPRWCCTGQPIRHLVSTPSRMTCSTSPAVAIRQCLTHAHGERRTWNRSRWAWADEHRNYACVCPGNSLIHARTHMHTRTRANAHVLAYSTIIDFCVRCSHAAIGRLGT